MEKYFTVNSDGCSIGCKIYADDISAVRKAVLFGHGFSGNRDNKAAEKLAKHLTDKNRGAALVIFDWPCHGSDVRKTLRLEDCEKYLDVMLSYVKGAFAQAELYGSATSFGGYLYLKHISEKGNPFKKAALRCPAVVMYEVITQTIADEGDMKRLAKGKPIEVGFDSKVRIDARFVESLRMNDLTARDLRAFSDDILMIHGTQDEIVPFDAVKEFAERNGIELDAVEGADHKFRDPAKMDRVIKRMAEYFGMK
ncbi:MAG: alpha/beta hydrolase [Clostridia bacterium]|nr:alpha/beta hydrolase [Clostridia bacterium]